jgi:UDP-N-acetylglucosamine--N-acetylmuramyl-(pentapeptide) pyrophosphoryl-undecaprenol N-acetylglucosamine transferase
MRKKVLIAAGGSGGHLFPAQQLANQLQDTADVIIAGHNIGASPFYLKKTPFQDISASVPKRGRYFRFFFSSCKGLFQSIRLLLRFSPDVVVGFGSYHTFPVLLAAAIFRKKIVLFEANCILGKVNRLFAPVAKKIAIQFPLAQPLPKSVFVPLLPWGKKGPEKLISREDARIYFGLHPHRTTVLIFGGSQGAAFFNETMPQVVLPGIQVIHCTGKGNVIYPNGNACVREFEKRMDLAYTAADIVICRSGAGTLSELIRFKKPSLLIPFPFATDHHQLLNARFLVNLVKGARLLEQKDATPENLAREINILLKDVLYYQAALENWKTEDLPDLAEVCYTECNK